MRKIASSMLLVLLFGCSQGAVITQGQVKRANYACSANKGIYLYHSEGLSFVTQDNKHYAPEATVTCLNGAQFDLSNIEIKDE